VISIYINIQDLAVVKENRSVELARKTDFELQSAGCINAGLTGHAFQIPLSYLLVNKETTFPY